MSLFRANEWRLWGSLFAGLDGGIGRVVARQLCDLGMTSPRARHSAIYMGRVTFFQAGRSPALLIRGGIVFFNKEAPRTVGK